MHLNQKGNKMKRLFLVLTMFLLMVVNCSGQPGEQEVRFNWDEPIGTVGFILVTWEGADPLTCPLTDNTTFTSLDLTGLRVDTLDAGIVNFEFFVTLNGESLRSAIFVVYEFNLISNSRLSAFLIKPLIARASFLNVTF